MSGIGLAVDRVKEPEFRVVSSLGEFRVEEKDGWVSMYRLVHNKSGRMTDWTLYERPMMLEYPTVPGATGMSVCVSPYYTEFDDFKVMGPTEALKYLCALEAKGDAPGPVGLEDESGLEVELEDNDIPGTE